MKRLLIATLLFTIQIAQLYAVYFRQIGPEDGLCYPSVISIYQDTLGRMWFGTREGLSIYDGNHIESYQQFNRYRPDRSNFSQKGIKDFAHDKEGNVFFRSGYDIIRYDIKKNQFDQVSKVKFSALSGRGDSIWAHSNKGLHLWSETDKRFNFVAQTGLKEVNKLKVDSQHRIWFGTVNGVFCTKDRKSYEKIIGKIDVSSIFESRSGAIWVGSLNNGLYKLEGKKITQYTRENSEHKGFSCDQIRQISEDRRGHIWFGTFNGLGEFNQANETFQFYSRDQREGALNHSSVYAVCQDKEGTLWVGTYFGGVNYTRINENERYFHTSTSKENTLSSPVVGNMVEDKGGNIWICTEGGGLNMYSPETTQFQRFTTDKHPYYLPNTNLKSIQYDSVNHRLYIGTHLGGLHSYNIVSKQFKDLFQIEQNPKHPLRVVNQVNIHKQRYIIASDRIVYIQNKKKERPSILYRSVQSNLITLLDRQDRLWIADETSLGCIDMDALDERKWINLEKYEIQSAITCIVESSKGDILIGTQGDGMWAYNPENEHIRKVSNPLLHDRTCYKIAETPQGNYLMTGEKHLTILSPQGETVRLYKLGKEIPIFSFTVDCGLLVASDSTIYVGGTNGLITLKEEKYTLPSSGERVYFSRMELANEQEHMSSIIPLHHQKRVDLESNQNRIMVSFASSLHIEGFNASNYEYLMEGVDNQWYTATESEISYTNLSSGKYTLRVRNRFADTSSEEARLEIVIATPWYLSWGACLVWLSLLLIILWMIAKEMDYRRKIRFEVLKERFEKTQMQKMNEDKLNFFTQISHELKTPLTLIIAQVELAMQTKGINPFVHRKLLRVKEQCQQLEKLMVDLIDFRKFDQRVAKLKYSRTSVNELVRTIYKSFEILSSRNNITFTLELLEEDQIIAIDSKEMSKVLNNLILNAFKFTPKEGRIAVSIQSSADGFVTICVEDSGVGLTKEQQQNIFKQFYNPGKQSKNELNKRGSGIGLHLVKSIVEMHEGKITVESELGVGTTFSVVIPARSAHELPVDQNIAEWIDTNPMEEVEEVRLELEESPEIKAKLLIVEDNDELLHILEDLFKPLYHVQTACNGQQGYEKAREWMPDLVITDLLMPEMNGDQLCIKIKNNIQLAHIPVILLTALSMPEEILSGLQKGADDYIAKPFNSKILLAKCANLLNQRRILIEKYSNEKESELSVVATNTLDKEFVEKVNQIIHDNQNSGAFDIDKLAKMMCMSRTAFYTKFKSLTGMTPNEYINTRKLREAAALLKTEKNYSISEISDMLGFSSSGYFCRKFKESYGVSPNQFRNEIVEK